MRHILPRSGDLFTLEEFQRHCKSFSFIDYDGTGYYATRTEYSQEHRAIPSKVAEGEKAPNWATHVIWFNR